MWPFNVPGDSITRPRVNEIHATAILGRCEGTKDTIDVEQFHDFVSVKFIAHYSRYSGFYRNGDLMIYNG